MWQPCTPESWHSAKSSFVLFSLHPTDINECIICLECLPHLSPNCIWGGCTWCAWGITVPWWCLKGHTVIPSSRQVKFKRGGKGNTVPVENSLMWPPLASAQKNNSVERAEQGVFSYSLISTTHETRQQAWERQLLRSLHALPQILPDGWFLSHVEAAA